MISRVPRLRIFLDCWSAFWWEFSTSWYDLLIFVCSLVKIDQIVRSIRDKAVDTAEYLVIHFFVTLFWMLPRTSTSFFMVGLKIAVRDSTTYWPHIYFTSTDVILRLFEFKTQNRSHVYWKLRFSIEGFSVCRGNSRSYGTRSEPLSTLRFPLCILTWPLKVEVTCQNGFMVLW